MKRKTERNVDWESIRIMLAIFFSISIGGTFCFTSRVAEEGALGRAWPMILILISLMSAVCSVSLMTLAALLKGPSWLMIILAIIAVVSFIIGFIKGN